VEAQTREIAALRNLLHASSRRERLELVAVRILSLLVVIAVTVVLNHFGIVGGGSQLYLLPVLLFLLILLPFDRIKSLVGKFRKTEAHAEFSSEPGRTEAHIRPTHRGGIDR
jgi:hypothetical protein